MTCNGRMMYPVKLDEDYIVRNLTEVKERVQFGSDGMSYRQMSLFDDGSFSRPLTAAEQLQTAVGQL